VEATVNAEVVFADDVVAGLAGHLGIAVDRALATFGDEDELGGGRALDLGGGGLDLGGGPLDMLAGLQEQLKSALGSQEPIDAAPQARELVEAAHRGDLEALGRLLDGGADPDGQAPWRPANARTGPTAGIFPEIAASPLYAAASEGKEAAIALLIERGADPDRVVAHGDLPLAAAAAHGHVDALEALLDGGADPEARRGSGDTALDLVRGARQQLQVMRSALGGLMNMPGLGQMPGMPELPDDDKMEACEQALIEAMEDDLD